MDVDDSTESRISLDALDDVYLGPDDETETQISSDACDDVYLGPDDEIDYDSGSSGGPDVSDAIPAQAQELAVFNNLDLYLGPDNDLIDCDEVLECADVEIDALAIPGLAISLNATPPKRQSPIPELRTACHSGHMIKENIAWVITNSVMAIFRSLPYINSSRLTDHSEWLGLTHPTNSEELIWTSRGCKGPNR
ncbi:hypothetical protein BDR07DRAFT_1384159 [Suillus spraguei]|nr:hypothetical protein BDR07DRAFT_1384159 [Suillus spraguei]